MNQNLQALHCQQPQTEAWTTPDKLESSRAFINVFENELGPCLCWSLNRSDLMGEICNLQQSVTLLLFTDESLALFS
jgi:hypothetical protein